MEVLVELERAEERQRAEEPGQDVQEHEPDNDGEEDERDHFGEEVHGWG